MADQRLRKNSLPPHPITYSISIRRAVTEDGVHGEEEGGVRRLRDQLQGLQRHARGRHGRQAHRALGDDEEDLGVREEEAAGEEISPFSVWPDRPDPARRLQDAPAQHPAHHTSS